MSSASSVTKFTSIASRAAESVDDFELLGRLLRLEGQWLTLKMGQLPTRDTMTEEIGVNYPSGPRKVKLFGTLVFGWDGRDVHVLGALVDYGWADSLDRTRVGEWIWAPGCSDDAALPTIIRHCFGTLFQERRVYAVRIRSQSPILKTLPAKEKTARLEVDGLVWAHFPKTCLSYLQGPTFCPWPPQASLSVSKEQLLRLRVKGPRSFGGPSAVDVEVRDPSEAHMHLIKGALPQRAIFFPSAPQVEEVDTLIVGAGISGLTANYRLRGRRNVVLEFNDRIGGTAAAGESKATAFPLGAHYEHDVMPHFGPDLIALWLELGLIEALPGALKFTFVDTEHYVKPDIREEAHISRNGTYFKSVWPLLLRDDGYKQLGERIFPFIGQSTLPSRLVPREMKALGDQTFNHWIKQSGLELSAEVRCALEQAMRSDYGAQSTVINAFAGIHYFTCRPYVSDEGGGVGTFSPPEGLAYFARKLQHKTPQCDIRLRHMVRKVTDKKDHVEIVALDLERKQTCVFKAQHVVYAAPKKALKYTCPQAASLFERNAYAAWITVTMEFSDFPARGALAWSSGVYESTETYVGMTWVNHNKRDEIPVVTHYLTFAPGKLEHLRAFFSKPKDLIKLCLDQLDLLCGTDASRYLKSVLIQKLGHAMPTPVPGSLFIQPNVRRPSERIVFAGVDTGRLPLVSEAFDSGIVAADILEQL